MTRMIGVDVGGTFTDVFVLDEATGTAEVAKVPTTRPDQSGGFLAGIARQVDDLSTAGVVIHGTTAGTNALLERKGATIGIITTEGLRDVLEMRRRDRPRTWGLRGDFEPVVPRDRRLEVPERTLADGTVRTPVDLGRRPRRRGRASGQGVPGRRDPLCPCLCQSRERGEGRHRRSRVCGPMPHVSASAEILPEIREFERFSTAALNAYLQPEVSGYIHRLDAALKDSKALAASS